MIVDIVANLELYAGLFKEDTVSRIVSFMQGGVRPDQIGTTVSLDGEILQARLMRLNTKERASCQFEKHRDHADVQCILDGREIIDWAPQSILTPAGNYNVGNDVQFFLPQEAEASLEMRNGLFAVFFPGDAHRPLIRAGTADDVTKIVFKVHRARWHRTGP